MRIKDKLPDNLVVVIDALDECSDPHVVESFLRFLFRSIADLPIKFYVTSRPEPAIRNWMMSESERSRTILYLHEIEKSLVQADIELYLKEELGVMSPAVSDIRKLAGRAGNLFIYAATAIRYIRPIGKAVDSRTRLSTILIVNSGPQQKLSGIDALYSTILTTAISDGELESEEREHIRLVLWTATCACEPIRISTLSALCGINNPDSTATALQPLQSVLHVSDHSELVTTLHASFPEYMLAKERSGVFFCDKAAHNQLLAERCFQIMQVQLRFNICSIKSSFTPDDEIPELEERITTNISEELFYSCRFWIDHSMRTDPGNTLLPLVHGFLSQQLLFWMEVLNLKKCITTGTTVLSKLNTWLAQPSPLERPALVLFALVQGDSQSIRHTSGKAGGI
ncbi:WD repeat-containing protein 38 [Ceratobasidium sp. 423]|nr:WD repeat-containing protein 38 [Ceratobasidium sp. 423]